MQTFTEFLRSNLTYVLPAPGGSIDGGKSATDNQADAYLATIAQIVKERGMTRNEAIDVFFTKIAQIENQEHFGAADDVKVIERLGAWALELAH